MCRILARAGAAGLFAVIVFTGCSSATSTVARNPGSQAVPADVRPAHPADVHFMAGMIPHHAQAVKIANWAVSHGARREVAVLAERIIVSQRDEIELIQNWLRDRNQQVPDANATHMKMSMGGVEHDMLMPGMLTDEQLAQLDRARGVEFDRLFLTFMIRHHEGALEMVEKLFASAGAAQDDMVYKFASDVFADQTAEIDRMQALLTSLPAIGRVP